MATSAPEKPVDRSAAKKALQRAGISADLRGYTPDQLERAAGADDSEHGETLRRRIMGNGSTSTSTGKSRRPRYTEDVRAAAKIVRDVLGGTGAPGPKQIKLVAKAIGETSPIEASGLSKRRLTGYAKGEWKPGAGEKPAQMQAITQKVRVSWVSGRRLAAILYALDRVDA